MMQAALNEAEASAVCGSAGIGRQAGLRCLCSTIDVRVQVPSPAPGKELDLVTKSSSFVLYSVIRRRDRRTAVNYPPTKVSGLVTPR